MTSPETTLGNMIRILIKVCNPTVHLTAGLLSHRSIALVICGAALASACAPGEEDLYKIESGTEESGTVAFVNESMTMNESTTSPVENVPQALAGGDTPLAELRIIEPEFGAATGSRVPNQETGTPIESVSQPTADIDESVIESPHVEPELEYLTTSDSESVSFSPVEAPQTETETETEQSVIENGIESFSSDTFEIVSINVSALSTNTATVDWELSNNGTGQIWYGPADNDLRFSTTPENRFIFLSHAQTISNLDQDTQYFFQVQSESPSGELVRSEILSFRTYQQSATNLQTAEESTIPIQPPSAALPSNNASWPSSADNNIPYSGLFYGQYESGFHTGNSRIAMQSSRRFRADRTGFVNAVSYNNRTLADANITGRCTTANPNSVWCRCKNAGLDKYTCGYTLSNSYSVGNGGSIVVQIRANDPENGNIPDSVVLGETRIPFVPMENENVYSPILELRSPVYLNAGDIYHLVYVNLNPPSNCSLSGVNVSVASGCPKTQGAMGLNGVTLVKTMGLDGGLDPFRGNSGGTLTRSSLTDPWIEDQNTLSWYEIRYSDGVWRGDSYAAYASISAGRQTIGGNKIARQIFTVRDATRMVDGLWLNYGFDKGTVSESSIISLALKDSDSTVLTRGTLNTSDECVELTLSGNATGKLLDRHCKQWGYTEFDQVTPLIEGNTYSLEISAPSDSDLVLATVFELNYGPYTFNSSNRWTDAHAEISINNGATWTNWEGANRRLRDLTMMFTIAGMPRQLP